MTQHDERVSQQRLLLEAEKWAKVPKSVHIHQLKSMWYDDRPADTDEGPVMDIQYNDGSIERTIIKTGEKIIMGKKLQGEELVYEYSRHNPRS